MSDPVYHIMCAAITNGCRSAFAIDGPLGIEINNLDREVKEDRRIRDLLLMSGWSRQYGRWVCANHEPKPLHAGRERHDMIHDLLRHRSFSISFRRLETRIVIVVHCECGRKLDMLDSLDGSILLYWLVDHDDEMFLTPEQFEARHSAQIKRIDLSADVAALGALPGFALVPEDVAPTRMDVHQRISGRLDRGDGPEGGRALAYDPDERLNLPRP